MALLRREHTGNGDYLDIAMHDATLAALRQHPRADLRGEPAAGRATRAHHRAGSAFYRPIGPPTAATSRWAARRRKFVENLLGALARPDLIPLCLRGPARISSR